MSGFRTLSGAIAVAAGLLGAQVVAHAADLYGGRGSLKDGYGAAPIAAPAGPCYLRADVGYSLSGTPDVRWPVTDGVTGEWLGDKVSKVEINDTWLAEGGFGCSTTSGWRGEIMLGFRGDRKIDGEPILWNPGGLPLTDPLHTKLTSYTLMLNGYRDLGSWGNFTPYVGAGVGLAYHDVHKVTFTENPFLVNAIDGKDDVAFAWQLMAGVGYRLSERAVLDIGYRYADLGKATSGRLDSAGFINPRVVIDDITAHEVKVGLRFQFGARGAPVTLK